MLYEMDYQNNKLTTRVDYKSIIIQFIYAICGGG